MSDNPEDLDSILVAPETLGATAVTSTPNKAIHVNQNDSNVSQNTSRKTSRIYSVSFQDHGFIIRENTATTANRKWDFSNCSFTDKDTDRQKSLRENESPPVEIPGSFQEEDFDENYDDGVVDVNDKRRLLNKQKRPQLLSKSLDFKRGSNYNTIASGSPSRKLIFCVHGNQYGFASCCDDVVSNDNRRPETSSVIMTGTFDESQNTRRSSRTNGTSPSELHCHTDRGDNGIDIKARNKLLLASFICLFFMTLEIIGGILANSLAIATDAAHLLTDFASFCISLFSIWVAAKPTSQRMNFGWHRAEVLGATISVLLIWVVAGILVYMAVERIIAKTYEVDAVIMLITSGVGVLVNVIMGCTLHQHGHGHSHGGGGGGHGHSHGNAEEGHAEGEEDQVVAERRRKENINVKAAFIHVIGDFIQSVGVFCAALTIYFKPNYGIVDPICTFIFSVLVLATTIRILKDTMNVLMEGLPRDINFNVVQDTFLGVNGIVAVHNLRIWGLTTDKIALAAHLAIAPGYNAQTILKEASTQIRAKYDFYEMTLQVEDFEDDMSECNQCKVPEK